jgi:hypothetical protein
MKNIFALVLILMLSSHAMSGVISMKNRNDFSGGNLTQVCTDCNFGTITLLAASNLSEDAFDQGFLKSFWTSYVGTTTIATNGKLSVQATAGSTPSGIRNIYLGTSADGEFSTRVTPEGLGNSGTIYFSGTPWTTNYFGICVAWSGSLTEATVLISNGTTVTAAPNTIISGLTAANLKITKTGNVLSAYYSLSPSTSSWTLLSSTTMTLSPANYSVNLGSVDPNYGGIADYQNFQVRPYALSGTWESQAIDIGGKPLKPGRVEWSGTIPTGTAMQVQCASSDDGQTWSSYSAALPNVGPFTAPIARYVKFKASLQADSLGNSTPSLDKISLFQDDLAGTLLKTETVKVTPNPARGDKVMLRYGLSEAAQKVSIELYAVSGRLLWRQDGTTKIGENIWNLDASGLASDSYLVRVLAWSDAGGQPTIVTKPFALLR